MRLFLLIILTGCAIHSSSKTSPLYDPMPFVPKAGTGQYESYLQMNINFSPVKELFQKIDLDLNQTLTKKNARTEAHITVITPVEYREILEPAGVTIEDINKLALKMEIQSSDFEVLCLGRGVNRQEQTYFLVVASRDLLKIRQEIFKYFVSQGGVPSQWDPELFYPHITVGYTKRDLHLRGDGIFKGKNSCWRKVKI